MAGLDLHLHDHATSRAPRKASRPDELAEETGADEDGVAPVGADSAEEHVHDAMNGVVNGEQLLLQRKAEDDDSMGDAPVQGEEEHQQQVHSTGIVSSASNGQEARGIAANHQAPSPPPAAAADPASAATDAPVVFSSAPTAASSSSPRSSPPPHQPPSFHVPSSLSSAPLDKAAAALNGVGGGLGSSGDALSLAAWGKRPLRCVDEEVWRIVEAEKQRQLRTIELIASENFVSQAVMEALGSPLCNKYSEGLPNARYYGGNHHIDAMENLCRGRALAAFRLDPSQWGCNVQPYSCTSANLAVFTGLLAPPKDRIMGLDLPSGGHLSHGYITVGGKRVSAASVFFDTMPYRVHPVTGLLDYDRLEERAMDYRPRLLVCGGSAYPREWDFARMRRIADKCGAILMCDMAHISGLVAAQEHPSPFDYVDVVTSTTHKTLRGPRGGIIFYRRGPVVFGRYASASPTPPMPPSTAAPAPAAAGTAANGSSPTSASQQQQQQQQLHVLQHLHHQQQYYDLEERINFAVFPTLQGGPHNNHTAALAVALGQVATPEFREYVQQVKRNAAALATALMRRGCRLVTNGTDNHIVLWDVRPLGLTGARMEKVCELCGITVNKNAVYGDATSLPGGIRLGTPAMTTRGCRELDMERIADLLVRAVAVAQRSLMPSAFLASAHSVTPSPSPSPWMSPKRQPSQHPQANGSAQDNHHPQQHQHPPAAVGSGRDGDGAAATAGASTPNTAANAATAGPGAAATPPLLSATPSQHHHQQHHHQQQQKRPRLSESRSCGADWAEQLARSPEVEELRLAVEAFALSFGMPGYDLDLNLDPQVHSHHEHPAAISGRPEMCKGQLPQLSAEPHIDLHARCQQGESSDVARQC